MRYGGHMHDDQTAAVTARIRGKAAERRIPLASLAAPLGIKPNAVYRKLQGSIPITVKELGIIADHLGVPVRDLVP